MRHRAPGAPWDEAEVGDGAIRAPGQKEIRATVAQFPLIDGNRNPDVDVSQIPRIARKEPAGAGG